MLFGRLRFGGISEKIRSSFQVVGKYRQRLQAEKALFLKLQFFTGSLFFAAQPTWQLLCLASYMAQRLLLSFHERTPSADDFQAARVVKVWVNLASRRQIVEVLRGS